MSEHQLYLQHALTLARLRKGFCAPNPSVGAIVVKEGRVLAEGYHWAPGSPHAEVDALHKLTAPVSGATLYVTLEPCCHWGRTPPCTDLIKQYGIGQVIYGLKDPNPQVAGQGEQQLRAAGISCQQVLLPEIEDFYQSYCYWWAQRRPVVTVKLAISLDAKIAGPDGQPVSITGAAAQLFTHEKRRQADAILTTITTIKNDDPLLNVRLAAETCVKPLYILDSHLQLPLNARILTTGAPVTVFYNAAASAQQKAALERRQVTCVKVAASPNGLDLKHIIDWMGTQGIQDLWVEAGGRCFQALLEQRIAQRAFVYVAAKLLGKQSWPAFTTDFDLFASAVNYQWHLLGSDVMCEIMF